jgi:hypothetical protein
VSRLRDDGTFGPGRVVETLRSPQDDMMPNVRERDGPTSVTRCAASARAPASWSPPSPWPAAQKGRSKRLSARLPAEALVADFQYLAERRNPRAFPDFETHTHFQHAREVFSPGHLHFCYDDVSWVNPLLVPKKLRRGGLNLR